MVKLGYLCCLVLYLVLMLGIVTGDTLLHSMYSNQLSSIEALFDLEEVELRPVNTSIGLDYRDAVFPSYRSFLPPSHVDAPCTHCCSRDYSDNIAHRNQEQGLCDEPMDVVYTWVNGTDPLQRASLAEWKFKQLGIKPDEGSSTSSNRFTDHDELKYSLRSISQYAPFIRNVYIVTNGQIPRYLNQTNPRLKVIPHSLIFPNQTHQPTFNSAAIETHLHRIPGISTKFQYFNDDVMLGSPIYPSDFFYQDKYKVYVSWPQPLCSEQCHHEFLGDGECDTACNVKECLYDFGDCKDVVQNLEKEAVDVMIDSKFKLPSVSVKFPSTNITIDAIFQLSKDRNIVYIDMSNIMGTPSKIEETSSLFLTAVHNNTIVVKQSVLHNNYKALVLMLRPYVEETREDVIHVKIRIQGRQEKPKGSNVWLYGSSTVDPGVIEKPLHVNLILRRSSLFQEVSGVTTIKREAQRKKASAEQREWDVLRRYFPQLSTTIGNPPLRSLDMSMLRRRAIKQPIRDEQQDVVQTLIRLHKEAKKGYIKLEILGNHPDLIDVDEDDLEEAQQVFYSHRTFVNAIRSRQKREKEYPWRDVTNTNSTTQQDTNTTDKIALPVAMDAREALYVLDKNDTVAVQQIMAEEASSGRKLLDAFGDSLRFVDKLYNDEFGINRDRKVIAHMPHAIDTRIISEMQSMFPSEVAATSSHKLRASDDMQYAFSYYYYIVHARPDKKQFINRILQQSDFANSGIFHLKNLRHLSSVISNLVGTDGSIGILQNITHFYCNVTEEMHRNSFLLPNSTNTTNIGTNANNAISQQYTLAPTEFLDTKEYTEEQLELLSAYELEVQSHTLKTQKSLKLCNYKYRQHEALHNCTMTKSQVLSSSTFQHYMNTAYDRAHKFQHEIVAEDANQVDFFMMPNNISIVQGRFDTIQKKRPKFICINDDIHDEADPRVLQEQTDFYETYYPVPSEFELQDPGDIAYYDQYVKSININTTVEAKAIIRLSDLQTDLKNSATKHKNVVRVSTIPYIVLIVVITTFVISLFVIFILQPKITDKYKAHAD